MAGLGRKDFQAGAVLSAADVDGYLMDQSVMKFANTAAAGSAYGTAIAEGMTFYLSDSDEQVMYDGTRFVKQAAGENLVPNGDFRLNSRAFTTGTASGTSFDRWNHTIAGDGTATISTQAFTPGTAPVAGYEASNYLRAVTTGQSSAAVRTSVSNAIDDVRTFAGQTVVVSFFAKAASGTPKIFSEVNQIFGTGGSASVINAGSSVTLSTSWSRYTVTLAVASISGKTIGVGSYISPTFWVSAGSDYSARTSSLGVQANTFDIWGVQVEAGTAATAFKPAGGNKATDTVTTGSAGFDGVLVATNSATNGSGMGTPAWAGYDVAGKNKIINGGFDFWQRGTSFTNPTTSYNADRWTVGVAGTPTTWTVSQQTFTPGTAPVAGYEAAYFWRSNIASVGTATAIDSRTRIEDVRTLAGQTATVSFWAKADSARTLNVVYIQQFGSGGSSPVSGYFGSAVTLSTSWARYTMTVTLPSIAGKTIGTGSHLEVVFVQPVASGSILDLWGVQLEAGSVATPFSRAGGTLQGELAACQRYYQGLRHYRGMKQPSGYARINLPLLVQMRAAPTITYQDNAGNASKFTSFSAADVATNNRVPLAISGGINDIEFLPNNTDSDVAYFIFATASAEL